MWTSMLVAQCLQRTWVLGEQALASALAYCAARLIHVHSVA